MMLGGAIIEFNGRMKPWRRRRWQSEVVIDPDKVKRQKTTTL